MGYQHGLFSWTDVSAPDPAAARRFYSSLFGWDGKEEQVAEAAQGQAHHVQ